MTRASRVWSVTASRVAEEGWAGKLARPWATGGPIRREGGFEAFACHFSDTLFYFKGFVPFLAVTLGLLFIRTLGARTRVARGKKKKKERKKEINWHRGHDSHVWASGTEY